MPPSRPAAAPPRPSQRLSGRRAAAAAVASPEPLRSRPAFRGGEERREEAKGAPGRLAAPLPAASRHLTEGPGAPGGGADTGRAPCTAHRAGQSEAALPAPPADGDGAGAAVAPHPSGRPHWLRGAPAQPQHVVGRGGGLKGTGPGRTAPPVPGYGSRGAACADTSDRTTRVKGLEGALKFI